jgi:putative ABC transport system permease protein
MLTLALRNVFRHRVRTTITLAAIVFGVVGLILSGGFVQDIFLQLGEAIIHSQSGHLQVAKTGFQAEGTRKPDLYLMQNPERLKARIASLPGVTEVMARVSFSGLLNNGRSDLAIIGEGIEPGPEAQLGTYMKIVSGRRLAANDLNGIMLGQGVAQALKLAPGDPATLVMSTTAGATNTLDVEVAGVFQTFSKDYDAHAIRVPLAAAHEAMDNSGVNQIVVSLAQTQDTRDIATLLRAQLANEGLEIWTWEELNDFYDKTVKLYDQQFGVLRLIVLAMVLLSVANSVNMSVFERVAEFGTMRALGNRSRSVFLLVTIETVFLGVIGASIGVIVGMVLAFAISAIGIPMPPPPHADLGYTARIQLVPSVIFGAFVVGVIATTFAGMFAALRVSRIPVVHALRQAI